MGVSVQDAWHAARAADLVSGSDGGERAFPTVNAQKDYKRFKPGEMGSSRLSLVSGDPL